MVTMTKRFYVTRTPGRSPNILRVLQDAENEAVRQLHNHPEEEHIYIVEVKAIARRQTRPITIEHVRK